MTKPASYKQINFLKSLLAEKAVPTDDHSTITHLVQCHEDGHGDLASKQASAYIDFLMKLPRKASAQDGRDKRELPDVPAGTYALRAPNGEVGFFKVDRPTRGKWAGYTFLAKMEGENHSPIKNYPIKCELLGHIAKDLEGAARLYGQLTRTCSFCHIKLTDRFSRFYGVGPVCRDNHGMAKSEASYRREATPQALAELDKFIADDEGDEADRVRDESERANREWAESKIEFAKREAEQEAAAYEAKMRRDEALFA